MKSLILPAPAKVNLYLKVVNKRPDGFHNLHTLFERISLQDEIRLISNASGKIRITSNHPDVPLDSSNIVYKAAEFLRQDFRIKQGIDIHIEKTIPVAAGLAGGSTNGASVLKGLNKIWKLDLSRAQLVSYGGKLGSDVPFFLYDTSFAWGTGRGDVIKPAAIKRKLWHVLVVPRMKMYTKKVFQRLNLKLTNRNDHATILNRSLENKPIQGIGRYMTNDLETIVFQMAPQLAHLKKRLASFESCGVMLSGSGPTVYAVTETEDQALAIRDVMVRRYKQVYVVSTL